MTGSSEKKNIFWTVAISISLLGIIGIGYVFDPEAEIFQEMTGLKLNYMNSSSTRAVANPTDISLISDPINSPVEDSHPGSNNMEDLGVAEDIILKAAILEEQDENESTDPELITEDKKEKPSETENYDTIKEEKTDAMNEEKTISEDIIKDADAFYEDNSPDGDSIEEAEIIDEDITFNSDNGVANDMEDEETDTVHRFQMYHLSEAIAKINVDLVREILTANPEYSLATDENGWTALHEAVRTGDLSVVKILVEEGKADINARTGINGDGESVFALALHILQSSEHPVARYLEYIGAEVIDQNREKEQTESNEFKMSDLSEAVANRDADLVREILTANPEYIRARDENGWTVLHEAVRYGDLSIVQILVEEGKADINARTGINGDGESVFELALHFLQSYEHPVARYLEHMIRQEIEKSQIESNEFKMSDLSEAVATRDVELVREILTANPEYIRARDENGWTVLHEAARYGDLPTVAVLVEEGKADINARTGINGDGESVFELALHFLQSYEHPVARYLEHMIRQEIEKSQIESNEFKMSDLSKAVATRDVDLIREILTANPEYIRARDENGWTVLHEAVRYGDLPTVAVLVEEGKADINARTGINGDEESVLSLALFFLESREHPVVRYLDDIGAKINPEQYDGDTELLALREAFLHNDVNRFEDILKGRPELSNVKDENGWTILHEAARFGNVDMATILVQIGNADVNSRTGENSDGGSPLYYALLDQRPMDHPIVDFLFSQDGMVIAPGQSEDEL